MFVIETTQGFVADFNERHQVVQFTETTIRRMQFSTRQLAQQWLDQHATKDKYFSAADPRIVSLAKETKPGGAAAAFHNPSKRVV
jgi:hypothetical protein